MAQNDYWYPRGMNERAAWHANWNIQLAAVAPKYNIVPATLAQQTADNDWIQYWVQARHTADALSQQLTKYFNRIATGSENEEPPEVIKFELPSGVPAEVPPGIRARVQEIANHIKGHMAYSEADGELLGIVADEDGEPAIELLIAEFTLRTLANFSLEATFSKKGMDAMRYEARHKGGNWQLAAILTNSPGTFAVEPTTPGTAEQIEVRAVLLQKNQPVGNYSTIHVALIAA
jgi:hypothetical protein